MKICEENNCTGCGACINSCKHQAIRFVENERGFFYPKIDDAKCKHCDLCVKVCPANSTPDGFKHQCVYAALSKQDDDRAKSTSGGIFYCLAKKVILKGGYVFGVILDDNLVVRHAEAHTMAELEKMRNSKYVQSDVGLAYQMAESRLKDGKNVLFSGTPCQIAGLRNYLKKDYGKLLTIDILCHGVPSPGMFRKYIKSEEEIADSAMQEVRFRSKVIGWKKLYCIRLFRNGKEAYWGDSFVPGFLDNLYLRDSCYACSYAREERQGDITLGDFWGYKESGPEYIEDDDKGISLVIINTDKGQDAFQSIHKNIAAARRTMEDARKCNVVLSKPSPKPDNYDEFWRDAQTMGWNALKAKYLTEQDMNDWMSKDLRDYYNIPYSKRHFRHIVHIYKVKLLRKLHLR